MKKILITLGLLLYVQYPCYACEMEPWSKEDTQRQTICIVLTAIDIYQTDLAIKADGHENNPIVIAIVGENPSTANLTGLFLGWSVLQTCIARILPQKARIAWQTGVAAITVYETVNSYGAKLMFRF
jgi:hypothetical protein